MLWLSRTVKWKLPVRLRSLAERNAYGMDSSPFGLASESQLNAVLTPMLKSFQENPHRLLELHNRKETLLKEVKAIQEKLPTAKPAEKKRLSKELENKNTENAKLRGLLYLTAG